MRFYKVYRLEVDGGIKGLELIEANGDPDAIRLATSMAGSGSVEVWDRSRLVGQVGGFAPDGPMEALASMPAAIVATLDGAERVPMRSAS